MQESVGLWCRVGGADEEFGGVYKLFAMVITHSKIPA